MCSVKRDLCDQCKQPIKDDGLDFKTLSSSGDGEVVPCRFCCRECAVKYQDAHDVYLHPPVHERKR